MIDNVRVCVQWMANEVAYSTISNSKVGMRVGFVASVVFNGFCDLYGPALSKSRRYYLISESIFIALTYCIYEVLGSQLPKLYAGEYKLNEGYYKNLSCASLVTGKNVEADFSRVVQSEIVLMVQCVVLITMTNLAYGAAIRSRGFIQLKPLDWRFMFAWVVPLIILASGFYGFYQPDFNKIILACAELCMKGKQT